MRVASNKLKDSIDFFYSELVPVYERSEIEAMVNIAVHHYLGFSKTEIIKKSNENINQSDLIKLYDCCKDLKKNIPLQYILAEAWFYHLKFHVNKQVLIPRPETEELVDLIIKENKTAASILDIGAGSGCIPIALKKNIPGAKVWACDISREALTVADENALINNVTVSFFRADILDLAHFTKKFTETMDVIASNPPYIKHSEKESLTKHVMEHEPHLALFVEGQDAIIFYKKIIDCCKQKLNPEGKLYFELNPLTAADVKVYAERSKLFKQVELIKDMSGNVRFFKAVKL